MRELLLSPLHIEHIDHIDSGLTCWARQRGRSWFVEIDEPGYPVEDTDTVLSLPLTEGLGGLTEAAGEILAGLPPDLIFPTP